MHHRTALALAAALAMAAGCGVERPAAPPSAAPASAGTLTLTSSAAPASAGTLTLTSSAVVDGRLLAAYRCEPKVNGAEASIPLSWSGVPEGTVSIAIAMTHHPDPAKPEIVSSYLLLWGIPPTTTSLPAGAADDGPWHLGANKDGVSISYTSPCSKGVGTHAYAITLYALASAPAGLPDQSSLEVTYPRLAAAIAGVRTVASTTLEFTDTTP